MDKCKDCKWLSSRSTCLFTDEIKNDLELDNSQSDCESLTKISRQIVSFNSEVSVGHELYNANISRDGNKLILEFEGTIVPSSILSNSFNVKVNVPEEEICCSGNCDTCITPIC